jgi:hypothetical protein
MKRHRRRVFRALLALAIVTCSLGQAGCFSFTGPSDVRRQLVRTSGVELDKEQGISVGPLGIALAQLFVREHLPFPLDGLSSVDVGVYRVCEESDGCELQLATLELDGWERIARIRDGGQEVVVLVGAQDSERGLRRLLVLQREGRSLHVVRAKGDLERVVSAALDSGMTGGGLGIERHELALGAR